jgi:hypothetical protein
LFFKGEKMEPYTPEYHRDWINRINENIAELRRVREHHERELENAMAREKEVVSPCGVGE